MLQSTRDFLLLLAGIGGAIVLIGAATPYTMLVLRTDRAILVGVALAIALVVAFFVRRTLPEKSA